MKNFIFVIIILIGLFSLALRCNNKSHGGAASQDTSDTTNTRAMPNQNDMTKLTVAVGDIIQVQLPYENSTGYSWYYTVSEDWIISMTEPYRYPSKSATTPQNTSAEDTSGQKIFQIQGLKKGEVNIRFYLVRTGETNTQPQQEAFYTIEVTE